LVASRVVVLTGDLVADVSLGLARFAFALEGSREVDALGTHVTGQRERLGTFVEVDTGLAVSFVPIVASALVSTNSVGAGGVIRALV
jgi:hypothetical protein